MLSEEILGEERLFRAVPNLPNYWKHDQQKYSSAIFKQRGGTSVDRGGGRAAEVVINLFATRKPGYGLVSILAQQCRECNAHPVAKPIEATEEAEANEYHAEIHDSPTRVEIKGPKAGKLRDCADVLVLTEVARESKARIEKEKAG